MTPTFRFELPASPLSGNRIKAGFHCHTVNSDGGLSPRETVKRYLAGNFQCLGITDHGQVTPVESLQTRDFIAIGATENGGDPDIIAVGIQEPAPKDLPLPERAAMLANQGGFTIAAHPCYCGVLPPAYAGCPDLMAMEIYNAYCDGAYANGYALELWDMVLGMGKRIWGVAGDDAHLNPKKRYYSDAGLGWVEIWAGAFNQESVLHALKQGRFFSTQGPVFNEIAVKDHTIHIQCSPVNQIRWRTWGSVGHVENAPADSELVTAALPGWFRPSRYVRIELVDRDGKRAWSNPVFLRNEEINGA